MWKVLYVSANTDLVEKITAMLDNYEIMNRIRRVPSDKNKEEYLEILVPRAELLQAQNVLIDAELN